ncbi:MAG: type II toxin-antitoxin system VapC family toxin [Burkholderiales bacterium]
MPRPSVLVDTGALVALARKRDRYHERVKEFLGTYFGELATTWPVLTEAAHLVPTHLGPRIIALSNLPRWSVIDMRDAGKRIQELMLKYLDRPMDVADASLVWAAEETGILDVLTLDWTDFATYRVRSGRAFRVVPV